MPPTLRHRSLHGRTLGLTVLLLLVLCGAGLWRRRDLRGLALLLRAADAQGWQRRLADIGREPVGASLVVIPTDQGTVRARLYRPRHVSGRTVVVVTGVHPAGMNEPRLLRLARALASTGHLVVTPELPDLRQFSLTPSVTRAVEQVTAWTAAQPTLAADGRVTLLGVSFSGGLAVVAAGRPMLRDAVQAVITIGGHDDLPRVMRRFCTPPGALDGPLPHLYGMAIMLLQQSETLVPPSQRDAFATAVRRFLQASYDERLDVAMARAEYADIDRAARQMDAPSRDWLTRLVARDAGGLAIRLATACTAATADDAPAASPTLSPARAPLPSAPLFLLHGRTDTLILPDESARLAARAAAGRPVRLLVTDALTHADASSTTDLLDVAALAHFWGEALAR